MLYLPIVISIIEVLTVTISVLIGVAFVTIAERKTMASMQRRLGPNIVGCLNIVIYQSKRLFHSSLKYKDDITKILFENRVVPVKLLESEVVDNLNDLTSPEDIKLFFDKHRDKGGIYLIRYKEDNSIFYIGRAKDFKKRLSTHLKTRTSDKFHLFANLVGWDKFTFSIIEICDLNMQKDRENFFLKEYLPILNTVLKSNFSESLIYDTLYNKLKTKQKQLEFNNKYLGISIYVYNYVDSQIKENYTNYKSLNTLSKDLNIARDTIKRYLDTDVPYQNNLFYSEIVTDFTLKNDLINKASEELELNRTIAQKVWVYNENDDILFFKSKEAVAKFLNVQFRIITNHLDKWIKGGIDGNYIFSRELNKLEKERLSDMFNLRKTNNCVIWVYEANNLETVYGKFSSMQKAAEHFKVDYRSILRHLDTNKVTLKDKKSVLFYSKELTINEILNLKIENQKNETIEVWVYKEINGTLLPLNNNKPTFNSRSEAVKELKIS